MIKLKNTEYDVYFLYTALDLNFYEAKINVSTVSIIVFFFFPASHPNVQYVADFAPELGMIIMETKYLEQLGFQVPELARNVALQVNYHA